MKLVGILITTITCFLLLFSGCVEQPPSSPSSPPRPTAAPVPLAKPPVAPSNLVTELVSQSSADIQWSDNSDNEDGFRIYRDGNIIGSVSKNITIYHDAGLNAGTTYHYEIRGYNTSGESQALSRDVEIPILPPVSPSNLVAEVVTRTSVSLNWADNADNEDGFKVYRDGELLGTIGEGSVTYHDKGLEMGKTYHYSVKAYNAGGDSGSSSCTVNTPNPPLNVSINYIGVKFDHDPEAFQGPGDIRLIVVVHDGIQMIQEVIPPGEGKFSLADYQTVELNQRIFHTDSVGDYLKIGLIAYDDDPESRVADIVQVLSIIGPVFGFPDISGISSIFSTYQEATGRPLFENADDYVGYYENYWGPDESWGIGQREAEGIEDFRVWFSIWSEDEPPPLTKPTLVPGIVIESVDLSDEVEVGKTYTYSVRLRNSESHAVSVQLKWHSSFTSGTGTKSVTVPANGFIDVAHTTKFMPAGVRTVTYTLLYQGEEIDSLEKTIEAKAPSVTIESVDLPDEVEVGKTYTYHVRIRNTESHAVSVQLKWHSSLTGGTETKSVTVPANGFIDVAYTTKFMPAGVRTVTYTLLYQGEEIDSLEKTIEAKAPSVTIESVDLPDEVEVGKTYTYSVRLRNSESHAVSVQLKSHSSLTGYTQTKSATISADGYGDVSFTSEFAAGTRTMTYTLLYQGNEIDSMQKTVEAKGPSVTIESVNVPATVEVGKTITYQVRLSNSELNPVAVTVKSHSSLNNFTQSKSVTVPANGFINVTFSSEFALGTRTMTYTLLYQGNEIDSMQKTVEAK